MSLAKPLVIAFSKNQLNKPAQERIEAVESAFLYLRREKVPAVYDFEPIETRPLADELAPFLNLDFYNVADRKRAEFAKGEVEITIGKHGLHEAGYILSGQVVTVELNSDQQDVIQGFGFDLQKAHAPSNVYCM